MAGFGLIGYRKPAKLLIQSLSTFWIRAGICATRPIRCPSLNTLSLRSAQGRGLALEAVTVGHKWFEEQRGPTRTVCLIKAQNEGSLRLGSKVGIARLAAAFTSTIAISSWSGNDLADNWPLVIYHTSAGCLQSEQLSLLMPNFVGKK